MSYLAVVIISMWIGGMVPSLLVSMWYIGEPRTKHLPDWGIMLMMTVIWPLIAVVSAKRAVAEFVAYRRHKSLRDSL